MIRFLYKHILKPLLFLQDPEKVHDHFIRFGWLLGKYAVTRLCVRRLFLYANPVLAQTVCGIPFVNPVGLSEGFDKDAQLLNILPDLGFGFAHIGSVTFHAYEGNPKPRLVRLPQSKSIVVNYGLKSEGVETFTERFCEIGVHSIPFGVSVAKTNCKETVDVEKGIADYVQCLQQLIEKNVGDFYTLNISCPNAFGGEPFTSPALLQKLLERVQSVSVPKPVFLKMPINCPWEEFRLLLDCAVQYRVAGVIIGNLNKEKASVLKQNGIADSVRGGLSGKPTWELSNDLIRKTYAVYRDRLVIIGAGGIFSAEDAYEKIKRGASLVQLITGMIFEGPQLIGEINKGLVRLLRRDGYGSIRDAIGAYHS